MNKISIITPTYNRAHLIPRMIESVINQSFANWELIIMDDGSTDKTREVISQYEHRDQRIKYYFTENSGAADKRNLGVEKAKGDFIIFLDSDDEVKKNWLELMSNGNNDVVCCGLEKIDHNNNLIKVRLPFNYGPLYQNFKGYFLAGTFLLKKDIFNAIGGYDVNLNSGHHTDLTLRLIPYLKNNNIPVTNIQKPLVKVYIHKGIKIRSNHEAVIKGTLDLIRKHEENFKKNKGDYQKYLNITALSAFQSGQISLGKELILKSFLIYPFNLKTFGRLIISRFKFLRNTIWK